MVEAHHRAHGGSRRARQESDVAASDDLSVATHRLDQAESRMRPVEMALALLEVGRCYREHSNLDAAEWYLQRGLSWARTLGASHLSIDILCELAQVCAAIADIQDSADTRRAYCARERARDHGYEATTLAARHSDRRCEASVLGLVSTALARCGDFEDCETLRRRQAALLEAAAT
jgi:hypothetical protein